MQNFSLNTSKLDSWGLNSVSGDKLAKELQEIGEKSFKDKYNCSFLLLQNAPQKKPLIAEFKTASTSGYTTDQVMKVSTQRIIPLVKSNRNIYGTKITVGRSNNNDVVIRAIKISKLHSAFYVDEQGRYEIADMESLNGTKINGKKLKKKTRMKLQTGDVVSFWRYVFEFIDVTHLIEGLADKKVANH